MSDNNNSSHTHLLSAASLARMTANELYSHLSNNLVLFDGTFSKIWGLGEATTCSRFRIKSTVVGSVTDEANLNVIENSIIEEGDEKEAVKEKFK